MLTEAAAPADLTDPVDLMHILAAVKQAAEPGGAIIVADLSRVTSWDDAALHALVTARDDAARSQTELRLVVWSGELCQGLQERGLNAYASVHAALHSASPPDWR
jgi:anti-anti-sigma regulatory factor